MIISSSLSAPSSMDVSKSAIDPLGDFTRTGVIDATALSSVEPQVLAQLVGSLSPQHQGQLAAALNDQDQGGLLASVLGNVTGIVDGAITTPSERQAEEIQDASQQMRLSELRGQAELEMVLAPYEKLDRPPAALASVVSVVSPKEGDPARLNPLRAD